MACNAALLPQYFQGPPRVKGEVTLSEALALRPRSGQIALKFLV